MKRLYARFVLWLIRPALNLRADQEAKFMADRMDWLYSQTPANRIDA